MAPAGNRRTHEPRFPATHTPNVVFRTECRHCGANPLEAGEAPAYLTRGRSAHPTYGRAP